MFVHLIANLFLLQTVVKHVFGLRFIHGKKREKIIQSGELSCEEGFYYILLNSCFIFICKTNFKSMLMGCLLKNTNESIQKINEKSVSIASANMHENLTNTSCRALGRVIQIYFLILLNTIDGFSLIMQR